MTPKFGCFLDPIYLTSHYPGAIAQSLEAERLGYDSLWVSDHLMAGTRPVLECFTMLAALASITRTIRLGSLVACNSYRSPSILAKIGATLDVISNGRLEFGIGAGWNEEEYHGYGLPFPSPKIRIKQMQEGIAIIKQMWTEEITHFTGRHYQIDGAYCEPKPLQQPHPPITIGGKGERFLLKAVAQYADRSNWFGSVGEFAQKMSVLETHCSQVGRDYTEIEKSYTGRVMISENSQELRSRLKTLYTSGRIHIRRPESFDQWFERLKQEGLVGTCSECLEKIDAYTELGVTYFILNFLDSPSTDMLKRFAEEMGFP